MNKREKAGSSESARARAHDELLKAALARPGIREVMKVYGDWQEKDRGLDAWRSATKTPEWFVPTDSSNPR